MDTETYMSFVMRLWREPNDEWRGEVEHIQTGNRWSFATLVHLLDFLQLAVDALQILVMVSEGH